MAQRVIMISIRITVESLAELETLESLLETALDGFEGLTIRYNIIPVPPTTR